MSTLSSKIGKKVNGVPFKIIIEVLGISLKTIRIVKLGGSI
jgi:hypothetical protein